MSDQKNRAAQRRAATEQTEEAAAAAAAARGRATGPHGASIFAVVELGDWVAVCSGPNFLDVGILRDVYLDELGRAIAVLDNVKRLNDETETQLTWLVGVGDGLAVPSTACTHVQSATRRWGARFKPW